MCVSVYVSVSVVKINEGRRRSQNGKKKKHSKNNDCNPENIIIIPGHAP